MKCVLCDRCKKIIEDPAQHRVLTCSRPLNHRNDDGKDLYCGDDNMMKCIIWEKDLCTDCATELEKTIFPAENSGEAGPG